MILLIKHTFSCLIYYVLDNDQYVRSSKGNGVDAFEGDIMMTPEQWEELKRDFERTEQSLPNQ